MHNHVNHNNIYIQSEVFAEVGEIIGGTKALPKIPDCGKKFIMFKSLGIYYIYMYIYLCMCLVSFLCLTHTHACRDGCGGHCQFKVSFRQVHGKTGTAKTIVCTLPRTIDKC